jgi:predicted transcriptional regulator
MELIQKLENILNENPGRYDEMVVFEVKTAVSENKFRYLNSVDSFTLYSRLHPEWSGKDRRKFTKKGTRFYRTLVNWARKSFPDKGERKKMLIQILPQKTIFYRKDIGDLIDEGLTLREMGNRVGLTKQSIDKYLESRGIHEIWEQKRKIRKCKDREKRNIEKYEKKQAYARLAVLLKKVVDIKAEKEPLPVKKLTELIMSRKCTERYFPVALKIFGRYFSAKEQGRKESIVKLGQGLDTYPMLTYKILKIVNLDTLCWKWPKESYKRQYQFTPKK